LLKILELLLQNSKISRYNNILKFNLFKKFYCYIILLIYYSLNFKMLTRLFAIIIVFTIDCNMSIKLLLNIILKNNFALYSVKTIKQIQT